MFEISDSGIPSSLKMEFVDMMSFAGSTSIAYDDLIFRSLDFAADYGLESLTPDGIFNFKNYLEDSQNYDTALNYLVSKQGFDPANSVERNKALSWYVSKELITPDTFELGNYICLMHKNISVDEFTACTAD